MPAPSPKPIHVRAVEGVIALLDSERLLSVAFNGPDGWPQVTTVGYLNEGLDPYFIVAQTSHKLANAERDPRASVAIRSESGPRSGPAGVSMSGRVMEVLDPERIERLNRQIIARYPDVHVYCPGGDAVAVLHFAPEIVSCVGLRDGRSQSQTFPVGERRTSGTPESRLF